MAKMRDHRTRNTVALGVCFWWLILGGALGENRRVTANAQLPESWASSDEKEIVMPQNPEDPLQFDNVLYLKKVRFLMGQTISARSVIEKGGGRVEDWLEDLEFTAKNQTAKTMTYIHLELQFPDTAVSGPMMVYSSMARGIPHDVTGDISRYGEPLALRPSDKFTFKLSAEELKEIKRFIALREHTLIDINRVFIQVMYLFFDDGIKWTLGGTYYRPNPNAPRGYERINR